MLPFLILWSYIADNLIMVMAVVFAMILMVEFGQQARSKLSCLLYVLVCNNF